METDRQQQEEEEEEKEEDVSVQTPCGCVVVEVRNSSRESIDGDGDVEQQHGGTRISKKRRRGEEEEQSGKKSSEAIDELIARGCSCAVAATDQGLDELGEVLGDVCVARPGNYTNDGDQKEQKEQMSLNSVMDSKDKVVMIHYGHDEIYEADTMIRNLLDSNASRARKNLSRKLIVLLIECNASAISDLHNGIHHPYGSFKVHQSWLLDDGVRLEPNHFCRSFICIQYCAGKTRVDGKSNLRDFFNEKNREAVLPLGMGGGIINMKQLAREIAYLIGVSSKYGS